MEKSTHGKTSNNHPYTIAPTQTSLNVHHARLEQTQKGEASTDYTLDAMIRKLITSPIHPLIHPVL